MNHTNPLAALFARINWRLVYALSTLAIIAACALAHLMVALNSSDIAQASLPLFGMAGCIGYLLICFASPKTGLIRLFFVVGALTTFWIQ